MANSYNDGADLFLDILTKEEKEALLSKKMEAIRKKNDMLRQRHEEIQTDKRNSCPLPMAYNHQQMAPQALSQKQIYESPRKGTPSPKKEIKAQYEEDIRKDNKERSDKSPEKKPPKNAVGRGKQLARMSKKELKAQDLRVSRTRSDVGGHSRSISFQDGNRNQSFQRQGSRDSSGSEGRGNRNQMNNNQQEYDSRIFRRHANRQVSFEDEQNRSPPQGPHGREQDRSPQQGPHGRESDRSPPQGPHNKGPYGRGQNNYPPKGPYGRDNRDGNHPYSGRRIDKKAIDREIELLREQEKNNPLVIMTGGQAGQGQNNMMQQQRNRYRDQHDRRDNYRDVRQNYQPRDRRDNYRDIREQYRQPDRQDNRDVENHMVRGANNHQGQGRREDWNNESRGHRNSGGHGEEDSGHGPPPDPSYNFLSDRTRERPKDKHE